MKTHLILMMLINAIELATASTLFCRFMEKRNAFPVRVVACLLLSCAYIFVFPIEKLNYLLVHMPLIAIAFFYIAFCYKTTLLQTVFLGTVAYTVKHISSLVNSIITVFFPDTLNHFSNGREIHVYVYAYILGIDLVVFVIAYRLIVKKLGMADIKRSATLPMTLLGILVLVMNQFWSIGMLIDGDDYITTASSLVEYIWNLISCILVLAIQFNIVTISKKDKELEIVKRMIEEKEQQYRMSKSTMDAINRKCHDLKYQIAALSEGGDKKKHIQEAMELVDSFDSQIHTGNDTLDVIFTEKNHYCKKHDISFTLMIDGKLLSFMDTTDQYVMFGNIVDNAINAVRKLEDHRSRYIYINVFSENKLLLIQTENPYNGEIEFSDGLPVTTTKDTFNHGYGMSSIRLIAEKYHGSLNVRTENGVFYLNVVIPMEQGE